MSTKRRSSIKTSNKEIRGLGICRFCKQSVSPPRKTFCSPECVHEWRLRSDTKYLREHLYERDLGICALCNEDTRYTKIDVENLKRVFRLTNDDSELLRFLKSKNITIKESHKSLWHADHILPVSLGGGETGLSNIRTLCVSCHKSVTKKMYVQKRSTTRYPRVDANP